MILRVRRNFFEITTFPNNTIVGYKPPYMKFLHMWRREARKKWSRLHNVVDVVVPLHDPTDPSTERTAPPRSAHVQLGDIPRTLDPVDFVSTTAW